MASDVEKLVKALAAERETHKETKAKLTAEREAHRETHDRQRAPNTVAAELAIKEIMYRAMAELRAMA